MKLLHILLGLLIALTVGAASARSAVPIVNFDNVLITTGSGKKPTDSQIQQAIVRAATQLQWTVTPAGENKLLATIVVRNKHTVAVDISWTADTYSIHYKNSVNMEFSEQGNGAGLIHPFYNKWVGSLKDAINRELSLL